MANRKALILDLNAGESLELAHWTHWADWEKF